MTRGIVMFATDDENIIKDVEDKISLSKNECNLIKETSKTIIDHLLKIIEKNINKDNNFEYEFERDFCKVYNDNISSQIHELDTSNLLDEILTLVTTYNKSFKIEKEITLPDNYKIKINKTLFDSFLKYIFSFCINSQDNYTMKINSDINYVVNKEIVNFIVSIVDKTNEKSMMSSSISNFNSERVEFINTFMNQLLESCNGRFRINKIDAKLMIEIHLIKNVEK